MLRLLVLVSLKTYNFQIKKRPNVERQHTLIFKSFLFKPEYDAISTDFCDTQYIITEIIDIRC